MTPFINYKQARESQETVNLETVYRRVTFLFCHVHSQKRKQIDRSSPEPPLRLSSRACSSKGNKNRTFCSLIDSTMASENPNSARSPMYPQVIDSDYEPIHPQSSSSGSNLYPTVDMKDLVEDLFPESHSDSPSAPPECNEEVLLTVPGAILHLIDKQYSVELATGDLHILRLCQGENTVAVLARVADDTQWPLTKDLAAVKLDQSHYFFAFQSPRDADSDSSDDEDEKSKKKKKEKKKKKGSESDSMDVLNYGLTILSKGQEDLLKELDQILGTYSSFQVHRMDEKAAAALGGAVASEISPEDLGVEKKKEILEERCAAYWTTLAPNVEEYSGTAAKLIAMGSGQLIKGILWCGDVTVDRLKWGNEILKKRMTTGAKAEVDPQTLKRIKRFDFWLSDKHFNLFFSPLTSSFIFMFSFSFFGFY